MTRDGWLGATDGTRLYWQAWDPDGEPRATVILVHGAPSTAAATRTSPSGSPPRATASTRSTTAGTDGPTAHGR